MPLQRQPLPVNLAVGENLGQDPLQTKGLQLMQNCFINRDGEIQKRPGMVEVSGGSNDGGTFTSLGKSWNAQAGFGASALIPNPRATLPAIVADTTASGVSSALAGKRLFAATSPTVTGATVPWQDVGYLNPLTVSYQRAVGVDASTNWPPQLAEFPGYRCLVYMDIFPPSSTQMLLHAEVYDTTTNLLLGAYTITTTSGGVGPFFVEAVQDFTGQWNFVVVYRNTSAGVIQLLGIAPGTGTTFGPVNINSAYTAPAALSGVIDVTTYTDSVNGYTYGAIVCQKSAATYGIVTFDSSATFRPAVADTTISLGDLAVAIGSMQGAAGQIVFAYCNASHKLVVVVATAPQTSGSISYAALGTFTASSALNVSHATGTYTGITAMQLSVQGAQLRQAGHTSGPLLGATIAGGNTNGFYVVAVADVAVKPSSGTSLALLGGQIYTLEWNPGSTTFVNQSATQYTNANMLGRPVLNPNTLTFMVPFVYTDQLSEDVGENTARAVCWLTELRGLDSNNTCDTPIVATIQPLGGFSFAVQAMYALTAAVPPACAVTSSYISVPQLLGEQLAINSAIDTTLTNPVDSVLRFAPNVVLIAPAATPPQYAAIGKTGGLIIGGATPALYAQVVGELGLIRAPELDDPKWINVAGGLTAAGSYVWLATHEWTDAFGNTYTSAGSRPRPLVNPANTFQSANLFARGLQQAATARQAGLSKQSNLRIVPWRTTNLLNGGSLYYRVGQISSTLVGVFIDTAAAQGISNVPSVGGPANSVVDHVPDSTITAQTSWPDPATTGILEPNFPAPFSFVAAGKGRIFGVDSRHPTTLWASNKIVQGVGLTFSQSLVLQLPAGGDITGLTVQDSNVIVGKANELYHFAGDGPDPTGAGEWGTIEKVACDTGIRDANSAVTGAFGTIFKSPRGYYLLDRGLTSMYIGRPVQHRNSHTVIRAVLMPNVPQVRFLEDDGTVLVWDYEHNAWGEYTYALFSSSTFIDICVNNGNFFGLSTDGSLWEEDVTGAVWKDANTYTMLVDGPWVNMAGVEGFQRVWQINHAGNLPASYTVNLFNDYIGGNGSGFTTQSNFTGQGAFGMKQGLVKPSQQKCSAMMWEFNDGGANAKVTLSALEYVVAVKGNKLNRLGSTNKR